MKKHKKTQRIIALFFLVQITTQVFFPAVSFALTSGPSQPEFSSFEPVATTNMVDEFSGDFTYNLPVLEVPGPQGSSYPLSLSYHSGATPEEESSWVGYGWSLNPGAINRNTRGLPDDFNGDKVNITYFNRTPKNWTVSVGKSTGIEVFSMDISYNQSVRYNNYKGFGYSKGLGLTLGKGTVSLGYQVSDRTESFSLSVDPSAALSSYVGKYATELSTKLKKILGSKHKKEKFKVAQSINLMGSSYGIFSYGENTKTNIVQQFTGNSYNVSVGFQGNPFLFPAGFTTNINGSYTAQVNAPSEVVPAYGYLYSAGAKLSGNKVMDYHVEKETDYNKRDVFLGVPFNDADNFIVTGEGLGGGFRLHNKTVGHFGPRSIRSHTNIYNVSLEIAGGPTWGVGHDLGKGEASLDVGDWNKGMSSFNSRTDDVDEPVFFRFNNDLGGEWGKGHRGDKAIQAGISSESDLLQNNKNTVLDKSNFDINKGARSGRSSYIGYNTNGEMLSGTSGSPPSYKAYNKNSFVRKVADRVANPDLIGEISIFNEAGNHYLYALPVYSKNERSISYSLERSSIDVIEGNQIVYYKAGNNLDNNAKIKVGQAQDAPYASSYLLTEITTPDYLDRGDDQGKPNGPTDDDLGGYTRFNYEKLSESYHWRAPYQGLVYSKNSHSDPKDDLGTYSEGEKEIYYLKSIETKTHVAIFKMSDRLDSRGAPIGVNDPLMSSSAPSTQLKKLDRIDLYTIQDCQRDAYGNLLRDANGSINTLNAGAKPIKTVRFDYDNSLCPGLPNAGGAGKLTLKKVYFEYNGIQRVKISPYEFGYAYPDYTKYPSKYSVGGVDDVTKDFKPSANQNPSYSSLNSDAWGNYQSNGQERHDNMLEWVDQREIADFDPAVWQLKVVKLPSGGQLHIQYEQDDYNYVQDQEAHVMATLEPWFEGNRFFIKAPSIGIGKEGSLASDLDKQALRQIRKMINDRYKAKGKKMYFKFLYSLTNFTSLTGADIPDLNTCNAEFITGYSSVGGCEIDSTSSEGAYRLYVELNDSRTPQSVCKDFVTANRLGMIYTSDCGGSSGLDFEDGPDNRDIAESAVRAVLSSAIHIKKDMNDICRTMNPDYSYLRIPTSLPKKGGGLRVKRLLMFDNGMENASPTPVLYGNEYVYQIKRNGWIISSGVATNEPAAIREENILVDFIGRKGQNLWSKIVAGEDKKQSEGPLGESILPAPSVGYSRVIVRNIHSGKTNPGFSVTEFNTAKDYPISLASPSNPGSMTSLKRATPVTKYLALGLVNIIINKTWVTQGFSFVLNNMHGQIKSTAAYSGEYSKEVNLKKAMETARTDYTYFDPGDRVPMMSSLTDGITLKNPGREVDMTFAQRSVVEKSNDVNVEVDVEFTTVYPYFAVWPTGMPSLNFINGALNTHATTKVVNYPSILKRVSTTQEGIIHHEEYVAFDEWTGRPVAIRSGDEFRGSNPIDVLKIISAGAYLTQQIPASWQYKAFTPKWTTEGLRIVTGDYTFDGEYVTLSVVCDMTPFTEGDKIELGVTGALYHVVSLDYVNNRLKVIISSESIAVGTAGSSITIFRTGKTNQLQQQAGGITQYFQQRGDAKPSSIDLTTRYESSDFATALKNATSGLTGSGELPYLDGTYDHVDISGFSNRLSGCNIDLTDATITHLKFFYTQEGSQISLQLIAFKVKCGSGNSDGDYILVKSEGWE